tara:strand:- start:444 stop:1052 length:609 start_codon:yes stop_codon:yes gene_type:complete
MKVILNDIFNIDFSKWKLNTKHPRLLTQKINHYYLLAYLSSKINNALIIDIGTHMGNSALALAYNKTNKIITYDLSNKFEYVYGGIIKNVNLEKVTNIEWKLCNIMNEEDEKKNLLSSSIIMLDTAHEGPFELSVYNYLKNNSYKGILILDDIYFNNSMKKFWNSITEKKIDLTSVGHKELGSLNVPTGTGLVDFGGTIEIL